MSTYVVLQFLKLHKCNNVAFVKYTTVAGSSVLKNTRRVNVWVNLSSMNECLFICCVVVWCMLCVCVTVADVRADTAWGEGQPT